MKKPLHQVNVNIPYANSTMLNESNDRTGTRNEEKVLHRTFEWFLFLLGFINRKIAVLGSGTGKRIVLKFKNNLHKKPELFGIVCRDVSF